MENIYCHRLMHCIAIINNNYCDNNALMQFQEWVMLNCHYLLNLWREIYRSDILAVVVSGWSYYCLECFSFCNHSCRFIWYWTTHTSLSFGYTINHLRSHPSNHVTLISCLGIIIRSSWFYRKLDLYEMLIII